jgi:hypothetical protein
MKMRVTRLAPFLVVLLGACGESGEKAAGVVQAATKSAAEVGQQLADKAAELAHEAPDVARTKAQELLDLASRELREAKDSETVRSAAVQLEALLQKLGELGRELASKLDLAALRQSLQELIERFRSDPRVVSALEKAKGALDSLAK